MTPHGGYKTGQKRAKGAHGAYILGYTMICYHRILLDVHHMHSLCTEGDIIGPKRGPNGGI